MVAAPSQTPAAMALAQNQPASMAPARALVSMVQQMALNQVAIVQLAFPTAYPMIKRSLTSTLHLKFLTWSHMRQELTSKPIC